MGMKISHIESDKKPKETFDGKFSTSGFHVAIASH